MKKWIFSSLAALICLPVASFTFYIVTQASAPVLSIGFGVAASVYVFKMVYAHFREAEIFKKLHDNVMDSL